MTRRVRIGNQTAFSAPTPFEPFEFAVAHGFDAFEWFADKKRYDDGTEAGWDVADLDDPMRQEIREIGHAHDIRYSVHAPWQANPLWPEGNARLVESLEFARAIGAELVNLHLYLDEGPQGYGDALRPVIGYAAKLGVRLSIENTPLTTPYDVNNTFAALRRLGITTDHVGLCLDLGHANLCDHTRNDYIRYLDLLASDVAIIHAHVHENYGDRDSHLTLFTGPAADNDAGIRAFIGRLSRRRFDGALILEQWPQPPALLVQAEQRLRPLLGHAGDKRRRERRATPAVLPLSSVREAVASHSPLPAAVIDPATIDDPFIAEVVRAHRVHASWRERLAWVATWLARPEAQSSVAELATIAIYLRFLGTGEVPCAEDGRHFRPNHHARAALAIEELLTERETPENAWIVRKILPWLPSYGEQFCRREPLTRIRDIAHRNDIPKELKREIKHRLQNKLHRCAGPEDFKTCEEILARITAPGASYSASFVREFQLFHEELSEFFNATSVERRLLHLLPLLGSAEVERVQAFLRLKAQPEATAVRRLALLKALTELREALARCAGALVGAERQRVRLADIGLEDYAFVVLSELANQLAAFAAAGQWPMVLQALRHALANVALGRVAPAECAVIRSELDRWSVDFRARSDFELRRLIATLERLRRLAEGYIDQVLTLFANRVDVLGRALGVAEHAIQVFCEGDIRGNVIFQLSKLVEMARAEIRSALALPPWEAIVVGEAAGRLVRAQGLDELRAHNDSLIVLLEHAEGDEEIPVCVRAILLAHSIPHLSHLGVRARQARIPFASADGRGQLDPFQGLLGQQVALRLNADGLSLERAAMAATAVPKQTAAVRRIPAAKLTKTFQLLPLAAADTTTCGAKAAAAGRLLALAEANGLFRAPRGQVLPFGIMERCLGEQAQLEGDYRRLCDELGRCSLEEQEPLLERLRALLRELPVPETLLVELRGFFGDRARLAVRSSANGEDLEDFAGAGLYDSVIGVSPDASGQAIQTVWASLWTRRAALSRMASAIPHEQIHMAVLVQEMIRPELSFIMHTADPHTGSRALASVELAVGLGETLASAAQPGTPYRLLCDRTTRQATLTRLASFSFALQLVADGQGLERQPLDYGAVPLSADPRVAERLGKRFVDIAAFLEEHLGSPQDVEGVIASNDLYLVQTRPQQGID